MLSMEGFGSFLNTKLSVSAEMIWLLLMMDDEVGGGAIEEEEVGGLDDKAEWDEAQEGWPDARGLEEQEFAKRMAASRSSEAEAVPEAGCS